jgi:hypothetical protein
MPPVGFEHTILVSERPKTHALDRTATGIGTIRYEIIALLNSVGTVLHNAAVPVSYRAPPPYNIATIGLLPLLSILHATRGTNSCQRSDLHNKSAAPHPLVGGRRVGPSPPPVRTTHQISNITLFLMQR